MPAPRFETLADLHRERFFLWIACLGCGRINSLTAHTLNGGNGGFGRPDITPPEMEAKTLADIKAKLFCSRCGGREFETTVKAMG